MTKTKNKINIARIIYDAYPNADLLAVDPEQDCRDLQQLFAKVTSENIGDTLFKFIVVEIVEGGEGTLDGAIRVIQRAKEDVESVLQSLGTAYQKMTTDSEAELLEACKTLTSYTSDLLYGLDNQINLGDVEEIQQAKDAIAKYSSVAANKQ